MTAFVPWGTQGRLPDVVVVQKKTALERYAAEFSGESAKSYFLRDGQTDASLRRAHEQHVHSLDLLLTFLTRQGLSFSLHTLDDFASDPAGGPAHYLAGQQDGLRTKLNLVLSVGGDGTLLRTSHFVGGDTRLVGINSVPEHSVGHLCSLTPADAERKLSEILADKILARSVRRLVSRTTSGHQLPYALNDLFFGHQHPASASRYTLSVEGPQQRSEKQVSSGVWIATPAGSTAAIRSYGLGVLEPASHQFLVAVREPYTKNANPQALTRLVLDGDTQSVTLFSRMRHGIVCVDGPVTACVLGFGETLEVGLQPEGHLQIFI